MLRGPHDLKVRVVSARNLRDADYITGGSDPYCVCTVTGRPEPHRTKVIYNTSEPVWKYDFEVQGFAPKEKLHFHVFDKDFGKSDDSLGWATLTHGELRLGGFDGDLVLQEAGCKAYLRVRVLVVPSAEDEHREPDSPREGGDVGDGGSVLSNVKEFGLRPLWERMSSVKTPKVTSAPCNTKMLSEIPEDRPVLQNSDSFMRHLISFPGSPQRLAWDLAGGVLIVYDSLTIPLQVFHLPASRFMQLMDTFTLVFWTINMIASFFVGYVRNGVTEMRPVKIVRNYLRTWFLVDLAVVVPDWIFTFHRDNSASNSVKLLRILRLMRTLRLLRLLKLRWIVVAINDLLNSEAASIITNIVKMITLLLFINHFISCIWFVIADLQQGSVPTWIDVHGFEHSTWEYKYLTSLHWSITQFTPASMHVQPQNNIERAYAVTVVVFALVGFSYLVGSITHSLTQLRSMQEDTSKQFWTLRRYLKQNQVPIALSIRIQRYLEHAWNRQRASVSEPSIFVLLSEQLVNELQCARSVPHLVVHPLFEHLNGTSDVTLQRLAVSAISRRSMARGDRLFFPGETATHVYFVVMGQLHYVQVDPSGVERVEWVDSKEDWISEPVLWTPSWVHLGTLLAMTDAELMGVDSVKFGDVIRLNPQVYALVSGYAQRFLHWVNTLCREELSDIAQGEDVTPMLKGFISQTTPPQRASFKAQKSFRRSTSYFA